MTQCQLCENNFDDDELIKLSCNDVYCWGCIDQYIKENFKPKIKCPDCTKHICDFDIRRVLSEEWTEKYENMCLGISTETRHFEVMFKCLVDGCDYKYICDNPYVKVDCPRCGAYNCMNCQSTHRYLTCEEFKQDPVMGKEYSQTELEKAKAVLRKDQTMKNYEKILLLDEQDLISNATQTDCIVCCKVLGKDAGVSLRCGEDVCRSCLYENVKGCKNVPVKSPSGKGTISERELRAILQNPSDLSIYLNECMNEASAHICPGKLFSCKDGNCGYRCHLVPSNPDVNLNQALTKFACPICRLELCLRCNESHPNHPNCLAYAESIKNTRRGKDLLAIENRIKNKLLMRCVNCFNLIEKPKGCNWVRCNMCRMELCWILQIRRWGPKGRNDNSGGCKCGVNGKRCSPECTSSCIPHND